MPLDIHAAVWYKLLKKIRSALDNTTSVCYIKMEYIHKEK